MGSRAHILVGFLSLWLLIRPYYEASQLERIWISLRRQQVWVVTESFETKAACEAQADQEVAAAVTVIKEITRLETRELSSGAKVHRRILKDERDQREYEMYQAWSKAQCLPTELADRLGLSLRWKGHSITITKGSQKWREISPGIRMKEEKTQP